MKHTIMGFNQIELVKHNLDMVDVGILRWLVDFWHTGTAVNLMYEGKQYVYIDYYDLLEDMPILKLGKKQLRRRLAKLVKNNILESYKQGGTYSYYRINPDIFQY